MATRASTPAEHRALEAYFLKLAKRYSADADQHVTLALTFQGTKMASAASLHDHLARLLRESAREAKEAAATHKSLATAAR